jgi:hypothetical protein
MQEQLRGLSEENEKLKKGRKYRVDRMSELIQQITDYRHDIQHIDQIISANTDKYLETAAQLRAALTKKTSG